ncbi:MAG: PIN domain-containing protein [Cellulomonadaceae bacterium]|jgi:toxin-antitoxin system PIN domain toxin|nr:PIN domain-containing protein [Cellulomonadaceae bacterium]
MTTDLPDINVLFALSFKEHPAHETVTDWFATADRVLSTPISEIGLLRLLLNSTVTKRRTGGDEARAVLSDFRKLENTSFLPDSTSLDSPHIRLTQLQGPKQVTDLHLFNLAVANKARFVTLDTKFEATLRAVERPHVLTLTYATPHQGDTP